MDEDVRVIGYCYECNSVITDDVGDVYVDADGNYFCCIDCLTDYYGIKKLEF